MIPSLRSLKSTSWLRLILPSSYIFLSWASSFAFSLSNSASSWAEILSNSAWVFFLVYALNAAAPSVILLVLVLIALKISMLCSEWYNMISQASMSSFSFLTCLVCYLLLMPWAAALEKYILAYKSESMKSPIFSNLVYEASSKSLAASPTPANFPTRGVMEVP